MMAGEESGGVASFFKGVGGGAYNSGKEMVGDVIDLAKGTWGLVTDSATRERAWQTATGLADNVKSYGQTSWADPLKPLRDVKDYALGKFESVKTFVNKASAEEWGEVVGGGGAEVGTALLGAGAVAKVGKVGKLANVADKVDDTADAATDAGKAAEAAEKASQKKSAGCVKDCPNNKKDSHFLDKKKGEREPGAVDMTPGLKEEIAEGNAIKASGVSLEKEGWPSLNSNDLATFKGTPDAIDLPEGTRLYRVTDASSNPNGSFWSLEPPPASESAWRSNSAVLNDWNGDGAYVEGVVGKEGLKGWVGPARAQLSSDGVSALSGGADQFVIPKNMVPSVSEAKPTPWNR